jgi:hypothetical protein
MAQNFRIYNQVIGYSMLRKLKLFYVVLPFLMVKLFHLLHVGMMTQLNQVLVTLVVLAPVLILTNIKSNPLGAMNSIGFTTSWRI